MTKEDEVKAARAELEALRRELGKVGLLSHGYVQDRGPGAGGPCYQWTRKVKAKTVSVALSKEQFEAMREAIANWKALKAKQRFSWQAAVFKSIFMKCARTGRRLLTGTGTWRSSCAPTVSRLWESQAPMGF